MASGLGVRLFKTTVATLLLEALVPTLAESQGGYTGRARNDRQCKFEPSALSVDELKRRFDEPLAPGDRSICAATALGDTDTKKRAIGLKALVGHEGPLALALEGLARDLEDQGGLQGTPRDTARKVAVIVTPFLSDGRFEVPARAAAILGLVGDPIAIAPLALKLADPDPNVRVFAIHAIREIDDPSTLEPLVRAMRDPYKGVAIVAISAVAKNGSPAAIQALIDLMQDRKVDRALRTNAAFELRGFNDPVAIAASDRYIRSQGVQWQRAFYVTPLLFLLGFFGIRREAAGRPGYWRGLLYLGAAASMLTVVGLFLFPVGRGASVYWMLVAFYPAAVWLGGEVLAPRLGAPASAGLFASRMRTCALVMWATVAGYHAVGYVLLIVGFARAWR